MDINDCAYQIDAATTKEISTQELMVSVIIPCFNAENTIANCLESVFAQDHKNFEILVYDDASTDNTYNAAILLSTRHENITVYRGDNNIGAGAARSFLLKRATGDYIAFLDADDTWHPSKTTLQLTDLCRSGADLSICYYDIFDNRSNYRGTRTVPLPVNLATMHLANWIPMSMAIFNGNLENSRTMPSIRRRQDYAFWLQLFKSNPQMRCYVTRSILGRYNRTGEGLSSNPLKNFRDTLKMFVVTQNYPAIVSLIFVFTNTVIRLFRA